MTAKQFTPATRPKWQSGPHRGITVTVSVEVHDAFERMAYQRRLSKAQFMRQIIEASVAKPERIAVALGETCHG